MKKMSTRTAPAGARRTGQNQLAQGSAMEVARAEAEQLERQRIQYETRARLVRSYLYNNEPARDLGRGWIDSSRK